MTDLKFGNSNHRLEIDEVNWHRLNWNSLYIILSNYRYVALYIIHYSELLMLMSNKLVTETTQFVCISNTKCVLVKAILIAINNVMRRS